MTLHDLIAILDERGVKLGARLVVDAPENAITDDVREALAEHRGSLLARLGKAAEWETLAGQRWGGPTTWTPTRTAGRNARRSNPREGR